MSNETSTYIAQDFSSPDIEIQYFKGFERQEKLIKFNSTLELHGLTPASKLTR